MPKLGQIIKTMFRIWLSMYILWMMSYLDILSFYSSSSAVWIYISDNTTQKESDMMG